MPDFGTIDDISANQYSANQYSKDEIDALLNNIQTPSNLVLITNSAIVLTDTSPQDILFQGLGADSSCVLPTIQDKKKYKISNDTQYTITISASIGVLVKNNSSFILTANTTEEFIFDGNNYI